MPPEMGVGGFILTVIECGLGKQSREFVQEDLEDLQLAQSIQEGAAC